MIPQPHSKLHLSKPSYLYACNAISAGVTVPQFTHIWTHILYKHSNFMVSYKTVCRINDVTLLDPFDTALLTSHRVAIYDVDHDTSLINAVKVTAEWRYSPPFLISTLHGVIVSFTPRSLCFPGKSHRLKRMLGGSQSRSNRFGLQKHFLQLSAIKTTIPQPSNPYFKIYIH
jgi:hypothetical protein